MLLLIIVPVFILGVFFLIVSSHKTLQRNWESHPTMDEYISKNPQCKTGQGLKCVTCESMSIENRGINGVHDSRRMFICNHCGSNLYRSA